MRENVVKFMAHAHGTVKKVSDQYAAVERRYNYVTPKSFLELISLYESMLGKQRKQIMESVERLESGLVKLQVRTWLSLSLSLCIGYSVSFFSFVFLLSFRLIKDRVLAADIWMQ